MCHPVQRLGFYLDNQYRGYGEDVECPGRLLDSILKVEHESSEQREVEEEEEAGEEVGLVHVVVIPAEETIQSGAARWRATACEWRQYNIL